MGQLAALLAALAVLAVLQGSLLGERREPPHPLLALLLQLLTLLVVVGLVLVLGRWILGLRGMAQPLALAAVGAAILGGVWVVARVREEETRRRGERVPVDRWRRAGLGAQPSAGVVEFQPGQTCPLCHVEHTPTSEAAECPACRTLVHLQCAIEMGRCPTLACAGKPVRVDAVAQPPVERDRRDPTR